MLLVEEEAWNTRNPPVRTDADPAVREAVRLQQALAYRLRRHIATNGVGRDEAAEWFGIRRQQLWRLLDGYAPLTLVMATAWAERVGLQLTAQ